MAQSRWRVAPRVAAVALVVGAAAAAVATGVAQSSPDKWWTGYSGGADNSRYFASRQITKDNVARLQPVWTYPFGDTGFSPVVVEVIGQFLTGSPSWAEGRCQPDPPELARRN